MTDYFTDENERVDGRETKVSPSGRYSLLIRSYSTKQGAWSYTRGSVVDLRTDKLVADVKRCYSSFLYAFVTKGDVEYLVTGRSYMGQTIVNLSTSEEWNDPVFSRKPDEGEKGDPLFGNYEGYEFCWAEITPFEDANTLFVEGCHWACPYEYRFYDFTDPSKGWSELKVVGSELDIEYLSPDDFANLDYDDDADEGPTSEHTILKIEHHPHQPEVKFTNPDLQIVLRRDGNVMRVVSEWSSERRTKAIEEGEKRDAEWKAKVKAWVDADAFFPWVKAQPLPADIERGDGYQIPSQNDRTTGKDTNPLHVRVNYHRPYEVKANKGKPSAVIHWGIDSGPIVVAKWTYGVGDTNAEFERSQAGLEAAYAAALGHVRGE